MTVPGSRRSICRRTRTSRQAAAVSSLVALVLASACGQPGAADAGGKGPGGPGGPGGGFAVPVDIAPVAEEPVEQIDEFVGTIKSRRSTTIQPQVEGYLTRILVKSGDAVAAGTPLFEVDAASQQATVASLESMRAAREADAGFARQQAERARGLFAAGAASRQELEAATMQERAADAQLKALDEQIRQQKNELAYYRVVATAAGVVGDVPVREGDRVTRSTALTTVQDNTGLEVYVNVPVQQAPRLRLGLPVRILDESGGVTATERVSFVSSTVDDGTQTVLAKAAVGSRAAFRADQFVRVRIVWTTAPAITIPVVAASRVNGQYFVFVAESGDGGALVARQRSVVLGDVVGSRYLVIKGLKPGDRLIVGGVQKVGDGAPVMAGPPPGAPGPAGGPPSAGAAPGTGKGT
jgi:RND family efflux transporter MFP subunit